MSLFPSIDHEFSIFFGNLPETECRLLKLIVPLLERFSLIRDEYLVQSDGSRDYRWKGNDRWLSLEALITDCQKHEGDGFKWSTADGIRLPGLEPQRSKRWRGGGFSSSGMDRSNFRDLSQEFSQVITEHWPLVYGGVGNSKYSNWMSCREQDYYQSLYGSTDGLPLVPSLGKERKDLLIDNLLFPGRCEFIPEGMLFVASRMWLGPEFWKFAACSPKKVKAQKWLEWEEGPHGILIIQCWPEPFNRPDGEQGQLQKKLWKLLFNRECHWPQPDGFGGPQSLPPPAEEPLPPAPPEPPLDPPQVATIIFDAAVADPAAILLACDRSQTQAQIHRGYYTVLADGPRKAGWHGRSRALAIGEVGTEFAKSPEDGIGLMLNTGDAQFAALGICASSLHPGKVLVRLLGPAGNPRWTPYYAQRLIEGLVELPGFERGWMGNVETELGIPTPPTTTRQGDHDQRYVMDVFHTPDRWKGQPIGSVMWLPARVKQKIKKAKFLHSVEDGVLQLEAWPEPFGTDPPEPPEMAVRNRLVSLLLHL